MEFVSYLVPCNFLVTSATSGGILDRAIEAEDKKHGDFLRLVTNFPPLLHKMTNDPHFYEHHETTLSRK